MKHLRYLALSIAVVGLSACQTFDGVMKDIESIKLPSLNSSTASSSEQIVYSGDCPKVEAVSDLKSLSEFSDLSDGNDYNLISKIDISKVQSACSYGERAVTIDLRMDFAGTLGPQGRNATGDRPFFSYPFFVAVTSASGQILAKEVFAASLTYAPGESTKTYTEKMRQIIPIENKDRGSRYKVLVGFQLTPNQLAYNRKKLAEEKLLMEAEAMKPTEFEATKQTMQEQTAKESYVGAPIQITP